MVRGIARIRWRSKPKKLPSPEYESLNEIDLTMHRSVWNFDGNRECRRFASGQCLQEVTELEHTCATMFDAALADLLPVRIQNAGLVELHSNIERKLLFYS